MRPSLSPDDRFLVEGSGPLRGRVRVSGAKNSSLKLPCAALMTSGEVTITNMPDITDVGVIADLAASVGATVSRPDVHTLVMQAASITSTPDPELFRQIRASISMLGPLVARTGRAEVVFPGGDNIGARRIDMHLHGLEAMGAHVTETSEHLVVESKGRLHGAQITFDFPSVGATENLVMAATLADGITRLDNAAREPEIQDLCHMLVAMGAQIDGIGTQTLTITGVDELQPANWTVCPDRIEAGTWIVAAALTDGDIVVEGLRLADMALPMMKFEAAGIGIERVDGGVRATRDELRPVDFVTLPYPGFPTDMQPQMMTLLTQAPGTSVCTENLYESRFNFTERLVAMGADITIDGHHAIIKGPTQFVGAKVDSIDVRAGAACVLAGLVAEGQTEVSGVHHIDRGYANFVPTLQSLGATISRITA